MQKPSSPPSAKTVHIRTPPRRFTYRGSQSRAYAASLWAARPRSILRKNLRLPRAADGLIASEWLMTGTNTGSMRGLPPTGKTVSLRGADFLRVEDGKIVSLQGYFDSSVVPRSLGLNVIVQPMAIGPFEFGTSVRASNGSTASALCRILHRSPQRRGKSRNPGNQPQNFAGNVVLPRLHKPGCRHRRSAHADHHSLGVR